MNKYILRVFIQSHLLTEYASIENGTRFSHLVSKAYFTKFDPDKEIRYDVYIELAVLGYCREYKDLFLLIFRKMRGFIPEYIGYDAGSLLFFLLLRRRLFGIYMMRWETE